MAIRHLADGQAGRRVMALDVALLVAGSKARGELQSRVTRLLADVATAGDVILM
jgi:ATP-dependent Clp protease ATP-binding subunit ClpC